MTGYITWDRYKESERNEDSSRKEGKQEKKKYENKDGTGEEVGREKMEEALRKTEMNGVLPARQRRNEKNIRKRG